MEVQEKERKIFEMKKALEENQLPAIIITNKGPEKIPNIFENQLSTIRAPYKKTHPIIFYEPVYVNM
jgi:hypothetical protein